MKKFNGFVLFLVCRHGWRCLNALGGVFAKQKLLSLISAGTLILNGCFSPYGADETNLTISLGDMGRVAVAPTEIPNLSYEVILDGPGGRRTESFSGTSASFRVRPGTYNIIVRAIGNRPSAYNITDFPNARMLRGWGSTRVSIRPGGDNRISLDMATATEVTNTAQFNVALSQTLGTREHIIVIKGDNITPAAFPSGTVTFVAEEARTIDMSGSNFLVGNVLTLGKEGMGGTLTLDGNGGPGVGAGMPLIYVNGGELIMNEGVTLQGRVNPTGNNGGGVGVANTAGSKFIMNGGIILDNEIIGGNGGGVFVDGIFTMNGGIIRGNTASWGGGVFVNGTFNMNDGIIERNIAERGGGVNNWGIFNVERGIIRNNRAVPTATAFSSGGGVWTGGTFTVNNFIEISGNRAISTGSNSGNGGGINWDGGNVLINNCRITNNDAGRMGGGIHEDNASWASDTFVIYAGLITENIADVSFGGGGLWGFSGSFTNPIIINATVTGNTPNNGWIFD